VHCIRLRHAAYVLILILSFLVPVSTLAQTSAAIFDMNKDRESVVLLDGQWHFHPGDDPHWADPAMDDSQWPLISSAKSWSDQGYKDMGGTAWYRVKIFIPEGEKPLALYIPSVYTNYELFADGQLLGGLGRMPPNPRAFHRLRQIYELPQPASNRARVLSIAIRVWHWPYWSKFNGGGLAGSIRIGAAPLIRDRYQLRIHETAWFSVAHIFLAILDAVAGLAALGFYFFRPREKEYLWFGLIALLTTAERCLLVYMNFHPLGVSVQNVATQLLEVGQRLVSIAFYLRLLQGKRNWSFNVAIASLAVLFLLILLEPTELIGIALWRELFALFFIPTALWILALLTRRAAQGLPDARLLLAPVMLQQVIWLAEWGILIVQATGWYNVPSTWFNFTVDWPFPFTLDNFADALFLSAMLSILIYRFTRTRKQEEIYQRERDAARSVQQILIPEEIPSVPGFIVHSVYQPYGEVGGDFFQILPVNSGRHLGSIIVVIGDVSGKGMPAAMTVSLIVGALRMIVESTSDPAEILAALNRRLQGRDRYGFTTCLILRADPDGSLVIANAGHLSPYINGREMVLETGLPLGLVGEIVYEESSFYLAPADQLTMLTDGVVEARGKSGELFGFERTLTISQQTVESIAHTAQHFGQDDDITVLSVCRN
jgi:hypothetical protein